MREKISRHVHSLCIGAAERAVQRQRQRASKIGRDAVATDAFHDRVHAVPPCARLGLLRRPGHAMARSVQERRARRVDEKQRALRL